MNNTEKNALAYQDMLAPIEYDVDGTKVKLTPQIIKDFLTGGADVSLQEYKMFVELCKVRKLNPFLREVYIIKYGTYPAQIVVGKDAILKRAVLNPQFDGRQQGVIVIDKDGEIVQRKGSFKLPTDTLVGGWAIVFRKDWKYPVEVTVSLEETKQTKKDGTTNSNWETKAGTMVEKVALVRALREAFVEDLGGLYEETEIPEPQKEPEKVVIEAQADPLAGEASKPNGKIQNHADETKIRKGLGDV